MLPQPSPSRSTCAEANSGMPRWMLMAAAHACTFSSCHLGSDTHLLA